MKCKVYGRYVVTVLIQDRMTYLGGMLCSSEMLVCFFGVDKNLVAVRAVTDP
jgi:hypothetical protein